MDDYDDALVNKSPGDVFGYFDDGVRVILAVIPRSYVSSNGQVVVTDVTTAFYTLSDRTLSWWHDLNRQKV